MPIRTSSTHAGVPTPLVITITALTPTLVACGTPSSDDTSLTTTNPGPGVGDSLDDPTDTTTSTTTTSDDSTTTTAPPSDDTTSTTDTPTAPKLDVGPDADTDTCPPDDLCCVPADQLPPHILLDAFITAYGADQMPHDLYEAVTFAPAIDEVAMAWSNQNTGDELIDPDNGGLAIANLDAGRVYSRNAALAALPVDAVILDMREDPAEVADLGGPGSCVGVGWAWGSVLFVAADESIGELVYLYVGYCSTDGDTENFFYSDEATTICAAPA